MRLGLSSAIGATLLSYGYVRIIEPQWLDVNPVNLVLPRLPPRFHGLRLVQFSDIHMDGIWMTRRRLQQVVALVNAQSPDIVVITGDFVTGGPVEQYAPDLVATLGGLRARLLVGAVLGNHDHWSGPAVIREVIRQSGLTDLSNAVHTLEQDGDLLHLAGVDDYWERQARLDRVQADLPAQGAALLLAHEPDFADISAATGRFDLQLSGHSHGGQIRLPGAGAPILPPYAHKYPAGLYRAGEMYQYTNRGVGMLPPRVRFNCRPEITVLTLQSPHAS